MIPLAAPIRLLVVAVGMWLPGTPRSLDRNVTRATLGFGGKSTGFSMGLNPTPIAHVSASPQCHPGRLDFPSPVGDHGISPYNIPQTAEA